MSKYKQFTGILVSIDLADFSRIAKTIGDIKSTNIKDEFFNILKAKFEDEDFEFIKDSGDAIFFFGNSPDSLLKIIIYFCGQNRNREFDRVKIKYRLAGHSETFNFKMENGKKVDLSSTEMNFLCRMEKNAGDYQFVVSPSLYDSLKDLLNNLPYNRIIKKEKIKWKSTPKGFEEREKEGLHLLKIKGSEEKEKVTKKQIKILSITASPKQSDPILYEKEQDTLLDAFRNFNREEVFLDIPDPVQSTLTEIEEYLADGHHDILQITAHGGIDKKGVGILCFEDAEGKLVEIKGEELAECLLRLKKEKKADVKIVILSSCHSARRELLLMPVAKVLHNAGIDAVIGMKESVRHDTAVAFNVGFFKALIKNKTVKQAFEEGKKAIVEIERKQRQDFPNLQIPSETEIPQLLINKKKLRIEDFSDNIIKVEKVSSHDFGGAKYLERGFIGRRDILRKIYKRMKTLESCIVIKGPGGIGKSAITTRVTANLKRKGFDFIVIHGETGPEKILEEISIKAKENGITDAENKFKSPENWKEKLQWFTSHFLVKGKYVLIFDNFEDNQHIKQNGIIKNKNLKELLFDLQEYLKDQDTLVLISTRYNIPGFVPIEIGEFSPLEFHKMLLNKKTLVRLKVKDITQLQRDIGGNPRAIDILDKIALSKFDEREFTWKEILNLIPKMKDRIIKGKRGDDFTPLFLDVLISFINENQLSVLKAVSIFRLPVTEEAVQINKMKFNDDDIEILINLSLIEYIASFGIYYVHRLTADFVLKEKTEEQEKKKLHKKAAKYWGKVAKVTKYDTNWLEARYHYWEAKEFEKAADIALYIAVSHRIWGYIDSALELNIQTLKSDVSEKTKANAINNLGLIYTALGEPEKALKYLQEALVIERQLAYKQGEAAALGNIGLIYRNLGEMEKALKYHQEALVIDRQLGYKQGEATQLGNIGLIYSDLGEMEKALKYHEGALVINRQLDYKKGEADQLGNIGLIYRVLGDPEKALKYHQEAFNIDKQLGDKQGEASDFGNIGLIYSDLGEMEKALKYHEEALVINRQVGFKQGEANTLGNIGNIYRNLSEPEKALKYYKEAHVIHRQSGFKQGEAAALGNIGLIYRTLSDPEKALKYLQEALVIDRQLGYKQGEALALGNIGSIYSDFGEPEKALKYYQEALVIDRQLGYKQGEATQLGNIGLIYIDLTKPEKALKYLLMSFLIFIKIKSPNIKIILRGIKDISEKLETDKFNKIVKESGIEPEELHKIFEKMKT